MLTERARKDLFHASSQCSMCYSADVILNHWFLTFFFAIINIPFTPNPLSHEHDYIYMSDYTFQKLYIPVKKGFANSHPPPKKTLTFQFATN